MKKILESYQNTIDQLTVRITELKIMIREKQLPLKELNSINARIEILQDEKYQLMHTAAAIRRYLEPKPITPSRAALIIRSDAS